MTRVIVAGGTGFFGSRIVRELKKRGIDPLVASRSPGADLRLNVERAASIAETLEQGDLVIDAAGPFQERSTALIDGAIEVGYHLIDLADSISYVRAMYSREDRIRKSGIRVRTACSGMSTLPALFLRAASGVDPVRVRGFLAPATKYADYPGTARALLHNVGRPIEVFEDGRSVEARGWSRTDSYSFPEPVGEETGYLYESTDTFLLPREHPALESVTFYLCPRSAVMGTMLSGLSYRPFRKIASNGLNFMLPVVRCFGAKTGGIGYEVRTTDGKRLKFATVSGENGLLIPVLPSVLAAKQFVEEGPGPAGIRPPSEHVSPESLFGAFSRNGIQSLRKTDNEEYDPFPW